VIREVPARPHLDPASGVPVWIEDDDPSRSYTTKELADHYLTRLLERATPGD
jgi:hypothetical protein